MLTEKVKLFMETGGQKCPITPTLIDKQTKELRIRLQQEELDEYALAKDIVEVADALTDQLYVLVGTFIAHGLGDKMEELFNEVHRSNMSKFIREQDTIDLFNDKEVDKCVKRGNFYVATNKYGKIIKPITYSKPNLKSIL